METETNTQTRAAVAVVTSEGYSVGYADRGVKGYTPTTYAYDTYDQAKASAANINAKLGLTDRQASDIILTTMSF